VSFLLDTNVVSEWTKPRPNPNVVAWLAELEEDQAFMSVISLAELRRGVELLPAGRRREDLRKWIVDDLIARFEDRVLDVDSQVAEAWGRIMARSQRAGQTLAPIDAFFAATAESHALTLSTRNVRDFEGLGITLHNPWHSAGDAASPADG
jgi:predicted nucleic acid-binding protein